MLNMEINICDVSLSSGYFSESGHRAAEKISSLSANDLIPQFEILCSVCPDLRPNLSTN